MDPDRVRKLLEEVARGERAVDGAMDELRALPFREIPGVATVHWAR